MSNKKQTSLDFYRTELMALVSTGKTEYKTEPEIYEQAQQLHKQEIMDAWNDGNFTGRNGGFIVTDAKEYYKEKYKE